MLGLKDPVMLAGAAVVSYMVINALTHDSGVSKAKLNAKKTMAYIRRNQTKNKRQTVKNQIKDEAPDDAIVNIADRVVNMARYWAKDGAMVESVRDEMEEHLMRSYMPDLQNLQTLFRRAENSNIPADREQLTAATNHLSVMILTQWQIPVRNADSSFDYGGGYVEGRARPYIQENPALRDNITVAESHAEDAALSYWSFAFPENKIPDLFAAGFRLTVS